MNATMMNESIYKLVLEYLTGEKASLPCLDYDEEIEFMNQLYRHKILYVLSSNLESRLSNQGNTKRKILETFNRNLTVKKLSVAREIMKLAQENKIPCLLIKGMALSELIYQDVFKRPGNDMDFWVGPEYTYTLVSLLLNKGFYINSFPDPRTGKIKKIHEPLMPHGSYYFEYDIHKDVDGYDIVAEIKKTSSAMRFQQNNPHLSGFTRYTDTINLFGTEFVTSDLEFTLLHLCANIYGNTENEFGVLNCYHWIDFMDLYLFINKYHNVINWNKVKMHAELLNLTYRVYKTFTDVKDLFGFPADLSIIDMFSFCPKDVTEEVVYTTGSLTDWTMSIKDRLFNREGRIIEYYAGKKRRLFSEGTIAECFYRVDNKASKHDPALLHITDKSGKVYAEAWFYKDSDHLYLTMRHSDEMKINRSDYQIYLSLFNNDLQSDIYQTMFRTYYDENGIYAALEDYKHKTDKIVQAMETEDSTILKIPFERFTGLEQHLFAFNLSILKKTKYCTYEYEASVSKVGAGKTRFLII